MEEQKNISPVFPSYLTALYIPTDQVSYSKVEELTNNIFKEVLERDSGRFKFVNEMGKFA